MRLDAPAALCTICPVHAEGTLLLGPGTGSHSEPRGTLQPVLSLGSPAGTGWGQSVVARQLFRELVLLIPQTFVLAPQIYL